MASFTLHKESGTTYLNTSLVVHRAKHDWHSHFLSRLKSVDNLVEVAGSLPQHIHRRACVHTDLVVGLPSWARPVVGARGI